METGPSEIPMAQPYEIAPPPLPGTNDAYAANLAMAMGVAVAPLPACVRHPAVQSVTYCLTCRSPVCSTCLFSFPGGINLCPLCAANPAPKMSPRRKRLMYWSIGLAIWSLVSVVGLLALFRIAPEDSRQILGIVGTYLSLAPSLIGMSLGIATFDRRLFTPGIVWFGVVGNGVVLFTWLALVIVGLMMS